MDIPGEVKQFHNYLQSRFQKKRTYFTHAELYDIIVQDKIRSVFPNLDNRYCTSHFPYFYAD